MSGHSSAFDRAAGASGRPDTDHIAAPDSLRLSLLYGVSSRTAQAILRTTSREELFADACQIAVEHGHLRMAWVAVLDPTTQSMRPAASSGHTAGYLDDILISIDDADHRCGPILSALRNDRPFVCLDAATDPVFAPWRDAALARDYRAMAAFPLRVRGAVVAVYGVYASEAGWFGDEEVQLLDALASEIGVALELLERHRDRERVEGQLRHERAFSDAILETMPGLLYVLDETLTLVRWNTQTEVALGYTAAELTNKPAMALCDPSDRAAAAESMQNVFRDGRSQVEASLITKRGEAIRFFLTGVRLTIDLRPYLVGIGIDVTARHRAEEARQMSDRLLTGIIESSEDAIFSRALDGRVLTWNEGARRLYGYTRQEVLDDPNLPLVPSDKLMELRDVLDRVARDVTVAPFETQRRRKDGTLVDISLRVSPLKDAQGQLIGASGIARDITARKKADAQVCRLREELEAQRLKTFRATMTTVQDIVNNFLTSLQLIRFEAEDQLSTEYVALFDDLISGTAAELKALGDLQSVRETTMAIGLGIDYRGRTGASSGDW
jgi:PAS domain S-box-containing protein